MKKTFILTILSLLLALPSTFAAEKNDSLRVLWVGNSYTYYNDLPTMVQSIGKTQKWKISNTRVLKGGERLSGHLKNENLIKLLKEEKWDYVILQEQSSDPSLSSESVAKTTYPFAKELVEKIRKGSPDAKIIFYQTWGHKYGNSHKEEEDYPLNNTYEGMQERINMTYLEMAWMNKAWCAPVGIAWKQVRSLHPEYLLYNADTSHPSALGSYLAANVIFCTMKQTQFQSPFRPEGISEAQAEIIQQQAQQTVLENLHLIGIK